MATTIELADAQNRFQQLVSEFSADDEIVFIDNGQPMARLLPITAAMERTPGLHEGEGWISDDFNAPLPDEFWPDRAIDLQGDELRQSQ